MQLKIPQYHLEAIAVDKINHPSYSAECCKAMLQKWMEITPAVNWFMLQTAIESLLVDHISCKGEIT